MAQPNEKQKMVAERHGIIYWMGRALIFVVLPLDIIATVNRVTLAVMPSTLPDLYHAWMTHTNGGMATAYYLVGLATLLAVPLGVSVAALLTFPLFNIISKRIDAAKHNPNRRMRKEMTSLFKEKRKRYIFFTCLAIVPMALFLMSFITQGYKPATKTTYSPVTTTVKGKKQTKQVPTTTVTGLDLSGLIAVLTFFADVTAPIITMYVVMNMEHEVNEVETQEIATSTTANVLVQRIRTVAEGVGNGTLDKHQAYMLKRGMEGDLMGALDAIVPRDETERMYTIAELCRKLNVSTDPTGANYRKIQRIIKRAREAGETDIVIDSTSGRGRWLVPGKLFDKLFGDYEPSQEALQLVSDATWTRNRSQMAPEAS